MVAILEIETRSENKKFSICPKLTFSFFDHVSIFNFATLNTPPKKKTGLNRVGQDLLFQGTKVIVYEDIKTGFFAFIHICVQLTLCLMTFLALTPPKGGNPPPPPFCFQGFTVAILEIETRSENKKFSICPKLTFLFLDHVSIFNIATVNPLPPKYRANHAQSVPGGSRSYF